MPPTKRQIEQALTGLTEAWMDDGVDINLIIEVMETKTEELSETMFRSMEAHVRQYQTWIKREDEEQS